MRIDIYTTTTCASCKMVKQFLDHKNIQYTVHNLDDDPNLRDEVFRQTGSMTVPVTKFTTSSFPKEEKWIVGYKPAELSTAIGYIKD